MSIVFAERLKKERQDNNLTHQEMADELGIPLATYYHYEASGKGHREPNMDMIVKIATILDTTADYLLGKDLV